MMKKLILLPDCFSLDSSRHCMQCLYRNVIGIWLWLSSSCFSCPIFSVLIFTNCWLALFLWFEGLHSLCTFSGALRLPLLLFSCSQACCFSTKADNQSTIWLKDDTWSQDLNWVINWTALCPWARVCIHPRPSAMTRPWRLTRWVHQDKPSQV